MRFEARFDSWYLGTYDLRLEIARFHEVLPLRPDKSSPRCPSLFGRIKSFGASGREVTELGSSLAAKDMPAIVQTDPLDFEMITCLPSF